MRALLTLITHQVILGVLDFILGAKGGGEAGGQWRMWMVNVTDEECVVCVYVCVVAGYSVGFGDFAPKLSTNPWFLKKNPTWMWYSSETTSAEMQKSNYCISAHTNNPLWRLYSFVVVSHTLIHMPTEANAHMRAHITPIRTSGRYVTSRWLKRDGHMT